MTVLVRLIAMNPFDFPARARSFVPPAAKAPQYDLGRGASPSDALRTKAVKAEIKSEKLLESGRRVDEVKGIRQT